MTEGRSALVFRTEQVGELLHGDAFDGGDQRIVDQGCVLLIHQHGARAVVISWNMRVLFDNPRFESILSLSKSLPLWREAFIV